MTSRPHVLMTADTVGGVWTYALDLGRGLADAGLRVTIAVPGPAPDAQRLALASRAGLEVEPLGGPLDWTAADEGGVAASAADLIALSARLRPDLIHLNSPALAAFGSFHAPVLAACHSCVKTWWRAVKGDAPLPDDLAWRAALVERGYGNATALMAPSRAFAQATRAAYSLQTSPHLVLNGRALPLEGGGLGGGETRQGLNVGEVVSSTTSDSGASHLHPRPFPPQGGREMEVLTGGRLWDEGKDISTLDRAVERSGLPAAAAGPLDGLNGQSVSLRHLRPLGYLSEAELQTRLARQPVFVSPSLYEPFGLAVLEAAQAGCPLVLSDIATFRELWEGAAIFFPPGDDRALAAALRDLALNLERRRHLGEAARDRAARYTAGTMTDATLRLYGRLSPAFTRARAAA